MGVREDAADGAAGRVGGRKRRCLGGGGGRMATEVRRGGWVKK